MRLGLQVYSMYLNPVCVTSAAVGSDVKVSQERVASNRFKSISWSTETTKVKT